MAKLIFTGSDVLYATRLIGGKKFPTKYSKYIYFACMTLFVKICDIFVECFYVVSDHLIEELSPLKLKKKILVLVDPPRNVSTEKRIPHEGFCVLYYRPIGSNQKFLDWVYGYDVVVELMDIFSGSGIWFKGVSGKESNVYEVADFYLRCNRHDGNPRMIMECEQLGIPYYWSKSDPDMELAIHEILSAAIENGNKK